MYTFLEEKNRTEIADNNVYNSLTATLRIAFYLLKKMKILINGLDWVVRLRLIIRPNGTWTYWELSSVGVFLIDPRAYLGEFRRKSLKTPND